MELPKRRDLPTSAVVLIVESLEEDTQINISKEAGKGVVNLLTPQDQVAVDDTPYDGSSGWVIPLQHVTNKPAIGAAIDRMVPGDPDTYAPYLQSAYDILKHTHARIKHIIVLGDGDAEDPSYQQLVTGIRAGGVTVSTVATNGLGRNDFQTMRDIAQWGGGRYYRADDPAKIPQIFLREARTVARLGIVEGKFFPQELSANPMLRDVHKVAPLYGYEATTPKPAGEMVLVSQKLDPVLAAWQYGLGRSVAWTSDASGLWTKDWLRVPGANRFWANLVSWVFPATGTGSLFIATSSGEGQGQISVNTPSSLGANPSVSARVLDPELHTTTVQLQPAAPNQFRGSFPTNVQGAYFVTVEAKGAGHADAGQVGMDVPYSPEYRTVGANMAFLKALAAAGGGSVITRSQDAWLDNLSPVLAQQSLASWLLLLALLLLPFDIGVRRLVVSRRELATILAALPWPRAALLAGRSGARSSDASAPPAVAPLGALRARRAQRVSLAPGTASSSGQAMREGIAGIKGPGEDRDRATVPTGAFSGSSGALAPRPSSSRRRPRATSRDKSSTNPTADESTTSRLLAAKRRK
jgi:hypothetical protein